MLGSELSPINGLLEALKDLFYFEPSHEIAASLGIPSAPTKSGLSPNPKRKDLTPKSVEFKQGEDIARKFSFIPESKNFVQESKLKAAWNFFPNDLFEMGDRYKSFDERNDMLKKDMKNLRQTNFAKNSYEKGFLELLRIIFRSVVFQNQFLNEKSTSAFIKLDKELDDKKLKALKARCNVGDQTQKKNSETELASFDHIKRVCQLMGKVSNTEKC